LVKIIFCSSFCKPSNTLNGKESINTNDKYQDQYG